VEKAITLIDDLYIPSDRDEEDVKKCIKILKELIQISENIADNKKDD